MRFWGDPGSRTRTRCTWTRDEKSPQALSITGPSPPPYPFTPCPAGMVFPCDLKEPFIRTASGSLTNPPAVERTPRVEVSTLLAVMRALYSPDPLSAVRRAICRRLRLCQGLPRTYIPYVTPWPPTRLTGICHPC